MNSMADLYLLDPDYILLNNGSLGACPRPVFQRWQELQHEAERHPGAFLHRAGRLLNQARTDLARAIDAEPGNVAFVTNVTVGLNHVIRCLPLNPGDEVLTSQHEYPSLNNAWEYKARSQGIRYIHHPVPLPLTSPEDFVDAFWQGVTPRTRVIFLSHITSPTALILPVEAICRRARAAGIMSIVDGAHVVSQLPVSMKQIGADFYSGSLHKWAGVPRASAFVFARPEVQHLVEPMNIGAWNPHSPKAPPFITRMEQMGTRDITRFMVVPDALRFLQDHHWDDVRASCHQLAKDAQRRITELTGIPPIHPLGDDRWFMQMATTSLPPTDTGTLYRRLYDVHKIEAQPLRWMDRPLIRLSIQAYNEPSDVDRLLDALREELPKARASGAPA